jgi:hypothetical protein
VQALFNQTPLGHTTKGNRSFAGFGESVFGGQIICVTATPAFCKI